MPGTITQSKIMQPAGNFHNQVTDRVFPVADFVLDDATALHTTHRVLDPHFLARDALVGRFLGISQVPATRFLGGLCNRDVRDGKSLKPHVLIQHTVGRQGVPFIINDRLVVPLARIRSTQEANHTGVIDQQDILDRVAFLLAAVILHLFIGVYGSLDWTFRAIMIKKGVVSAVGVSGSVISVARRAGRASSCANA